MSDREFILALKARCEQNVESFDRIKIASSGNDLVGFAATGNSMAYWAVEKMIEEYLEEQRLKEISK